MKNNLRILFLCCLSYYSIAIQAQSPGYYYNNHIDVKQGASLAKLKNPYTGGFLLPQFSELDLNMDGTKDLLIFDRGTKSFYPFVNDKIPNTVSYTYAPEYISLLPQCTSFCLSYDYNNDGKMDLFVQNYGFMLQFRNTSTTSLSFAPADTLYDYQDFNIYCSDPNLPSFNDIDNDGDMDILTWDPINSKINFYKNFRVEKGLSANQWLYKLVDECWGKFNFSNTVKLGYHCYDDYTAPKKTNGPELQFTLLTLDIDSDGDYDLFYGNNNDNALYLLHNGKSDFSTLKDSMIAVDSLYPSLAQRMKINNLPAAFFIDVDNDGKRDIILTPHENYGYSQNKDQIYLYKNTGTDRKPNFVLVKKNFLQESTIDFGSGTAPAFCDIDADGNEDLLIASHGEYTQTLNLKDRIALYKNTGTVANPSFELQDSDFLNLSAKNYSGIKPTFGDLNGDGKKDLLFGEANGLLKYYINTSVGGNISFIENTTQFASFHEKTYSSPFLVDFNRDGKLDLFLGNYDGTIAYFQNTGTITNPIFTKMVDSVGKICTRAVDDSRHFYADGMSVPVIADLDKDGKFDLLVGGKNGLYKFNNIEGKLGDSLTLIDHVVHYVSWQAAVNKLNGSYISPAIAQLDNDNFPDLVLGNNGGGITVFSTINKNSGTNLLTEPVHKILITPNPASNSINIEGFENEFTSLNVYDITGKSLIIENNIHQRNVTLDISKFHQGVYLISITSINGEIFKGKFVKL